MGDRLATIDMGRKLGGAVPLWAEADSPSNTIWPGPWSTFVPSGILIHPAVWPQQTWAENWEAVPLWGGGAGFPSNTVWPGPRHTCMASFILIHPKVWPQCTNVTDRQTGQTDRQRSDSIGRTVLQTVAQKAFKECIPPPRQFRLYRNFSKSDIFHTSCYIILSYREEDCTVYISLVCNAC